MCGGQKDKRISTKNVDKLYEKENNKTEVPKSASLLNYSINVEEQNDSGGEAGENKFSTMNKFQK